MREIKYIVIHCTATSQDATIDGIKNYWEKVLGWQTPGYHYLIDKTGHFYTLLGIDKISNGVKNHNKNSIHIGYIGGINKEGKSVDNRTIPQKGTILFLLRELKSKFPNAIIKGHRDFPNVKKDCPCFDAQKEYEEIFDIFG